MNHSGRAGADLRPLAGLVLSFAAALAPVACADTRTEASTEGSDCPIESKTAEGGCVYGHGDAASDSSIAPPAASTSGSVAVTLHPGPDAMIGRRTVVTFGAPFPPGALPDAAALRAVDADGDELKSSATSILPWRVWPGRTGQTESVRAALVSVEVTFAERSPLA